MFEFGIDFSWILFVIFLYIIYNFFFEFDVCAVGQIVVFVVVFFWDFFVVVFCLLLLKTHHYSCTDSDTTSTVRIRNNITETNTQKCYRYQPHCI